VVSTLLFGRWTCPVLRPIYGWQVTILWVNCPLWVSQVGQLSLPSLHGRQMSGSPWIMGMDTVKTADEGYVRLYGCRPKSVSTGLSCGLGWTTAPLRRHMRLAAIYKWTLPI